MRKKLGEILLSSGVVTQADLDLALGDQMGGEPARVGDLLVSLGRLTPAQLAKALSTQHSIPFIQLPPVPSEVLHVVPLDFQLQHRLIPFRVTADAMSIAMADPSNTDAIEELRVSLNRKVNRYVAASDEIDAVHAGMTGAAVDLPSIAPTVAPVSRGASPTAAELFGSLDLDAAPAPTALGDELFSGLDLPLPSTADVPPPPAVASVSPAPFPTGAPRSTRDEEEPEFFEAKPVVRVEPPAPPPPRVSPSPAPSSAFELNGMELEGIASAGLTSSPSGTFDLTSAIADVPGASAPQAESSGSFDVSVAESSGDFGDSGTFEVISEQSGDFPAAPAPAPAPAAESSGDFEVISEQSGDYPPAPAPAPAPTAESSGNFEVSLEESSGDYGKAPAPAPAAPAPTSAVDDFFGPPSGGPLPVASGAFSTLEEEAVSFEELPVDSTMEPLPPSSQPFFGAPETIAEELFSDAPPASQPDGLFAQPPPPAAGALDGGELFSDAPPEPQPEALFAEPPPPAAGALDAVELFSDAPPEPQADALFAEPPPPALGAVDTGELFSDAPPPAEFAFAPAPEPEAEPADAVVVSDEPDEPAPPEAPAAAASPPQESLPSWLGSAGSAVAGPAAAFVLQPGEWTGKLDDTPPSRLIVGAVKALVQKGLVTEAEILEALGKKP